MNQKLLAAYDRYLEAFNSLSPSDKQRIRNVARYQLKAEGWPDIGSSDISARVFALFREYGYFSPTVINTIAKNRSTSYNTLIH
jgi:hypothetical protein